MVKRIILVTGAPCSGKTTYVREHMKRGDHVLDQDELGTARMNHELAHLHEHSGTTWVIRCCPGAGERERLAQELHAELVYLTAGTSVLMTRARDRPHPARHVAAVKNWMDAEASGGSAARRGDPPITRRTAW